ncbi:MAG: hypothetical protein AB1757_17205 [Acidobacteriota bacterium]
MTTKRRIKITVFRCQRFASTEVIAEPPSQPSTTVVTENLVDEISTLVKRLTGDSLNRLTDKPALISADDDSQSKIE